MSCLPNKLPQVLKDAMLFFSRSTPNLVLRFLFSFYPVAAARPGTLTLVSSFPFLFSYAHGRYALIGHFPHHVIVDTVLSRATGSLTRFLLVCLHFPSMLLTHFGYVDSSLVPDFVTPTCLPDDSSLVSSRFFLRPVLYPPFRLSPTYPTGRYSCLLTFTALRLFVLVSTLRVYITGWRWDDPHLQSTLQPP